MGQTLSNIPFDAWVKHIFDHPASGPAWYLDAESDAWEDSPSITVQFVTCLFTQSRQLLGRYSDVQVNHGLWYLVDPSWSTIMRTVVFDASIPWPERQRCIGSILSLFHDCFAVRCADCLSHLDEPGASPINSACYMWWDIFPTTGNPGDSCQAVQDQAFLDVMRDTLLIPSIACRESALHGLGHWHEYYASQVEQIVDHFLAATPDISEPLRQYAMAAKQGDVL